MGVLWWRGRCEFWEVVKTVIKSECERSVIDFYLKVSTEPRNMTFCVKSFTLSDLF